MQPEMLLLGRTNLEQSESQRERERETALPCWYVGEEKEGGILEEKYHLL